MDPTERDIALDIEALELVLSARAQGRHEDLVEFAARDEAHAAAAARTRAALANGSTRPEQSPTWSADPLTLGAATFGPYRPIQSLGRGGQGEVWLAEDTRLKRHVALKILHHGLAMADDALLRFRREAEVASRLDHPGLCTVFEVGREGGRAWMAMRYVEGESLARLISAHPEPPSNRADMNGWLKLVEEIARAMHAAHEGGVIHRDLKPSNVIVGRDGHPVVLDFGLARDEVSTGSTLTATGAVFGTPWFMAPEQLLGQSTVDRRVDVYALGAILHLALTGHYPREGPTFEAIRALAHAPITPPRSLNAAIGRPLEIVIQTALAVDLGLRYRTALDLAEDLRRVRELEPILARPASALTRLAFWARRNRALSTSLAALFLVLVAGLAAVTYYAVLQQRTLNERDQVSDIRSVNALLEREGDLFPIGPTIVAAGETWLRDTDRYLSREEMHRASRERLRTQALGTGPDNRPRYADEVRAYTDDVLSDLITSLERLRARRTVVAERIDRSRTLEARTIGPEIQGAWNECIATIRSSPKYAGLELKPQLGLVPLGVNPQSGLYEFWHVETGSRPVFDAARGGAVPGPGMGVTMVLLPASTFVMGASPDDEFADTRFEVPTQNVTLGAFFISKFELTQDQWSRVDGGRNPSYYFPGTDRGSSTKEGLSVTLLHPVESVSWLESVRVLGRVGLALPTESQWEYAARGGTTTRWTPGDRPEELEGFANVAGLERDPSFWVTIKHPPFNDGRVLHAPVGTYKPNPFGLFDCCGNVCEWCADMLVRSYPSVRPRSVDGLRTPEKPDHNRMMRGGSAQLEIALTRSSQRFWQLENSTARDLGLRPARPVD